MPSTVTRDQILGGMMAAIAPLKPTIGQAVSTSQYVRDIARYAGEFSTEQALLRGMAGRTPAVLVLYMAERAISRSVSRRVDKVEGSYVAICCVSTARNRDSREPTAHELMNDVRGRLSARRLGLSIQPLCYLGDRLVVEDDKVLAYALNFSTRYRIDNTKTGTYDSLLSASGSLVDSTSGETVVSVQQSLSGPGAP